MQVLTLAETLETVLLMSRRLRREIESRRPRKARARHPRRLRRENYLKLIADQMLYELGEYRMEVVLMPSGIPEIADRGGMIRVAHIANPGWYQEFCGLYEKSGVLPKRRRKFQTKIARHAVIRALERISDGRPRNTLYCDRLIRFARQKDREKGAGRWIGNA